MRAVDAARHGPGSEAAGPWRTGTTTTRWLRCAWGRLREEPGISWVITRRSERQSYRVLKDQALPSAHHEGRAGRRSRWIWPLPQSPQGGDREKDQRRYFIDIPSLADTVWIVSSNLVDEVREPS